MAVSVAENLIEVRKKLKRAARKAGRNISEITLIAVTKNVEPKRVKEAVKEGLRVFGENYIQEAQEKIKKVGDKKKKWHFIGHLQKNKARFAVELFECIHSLDTPGLAREINRRTTRPIDVLIQVNITGEKTKHGATPDEAIEIARMMPGLKNLNFRGLMAIPPVVESPERSRPYFVTIRRLAERINRERIPGVVVHDLSMGMSSDFDIAIEEGATMVRVGTAIFGERISLDNKPTEKPALTKAKKAKPSTETKSPQTVKVKSTEKQAKTKIAPAAAKSSKKAATAKQTAAALKEKPVLGKKKAAKAAVKKSETKVKASSAEAVKAVAVKKTAVKKKPTAGAAKKKSAATAKGKTLKTAKKPALKTTKKATALKSTVKKKTIVKITAAKTTKANSGESKKPAKTTKTSGAAAAKKTGLKKTKKTTASKKKAG